MSITRIVIAQFDESGLGFPIRALLLGPRAFAIMTDPARRRANDRMVNAIIATKLREFIGAATNVNNADTVTVRGGEVVLDARVAPLSLADGCKLSASSAPARAVASVRRDSVLRASGAVRGVPLGATAFVGADLDVGLEVWAAVKARLGKDIFGRCFTKYKNTFPLHLVSDGKVWVGAQFSASNLRIEDRVGVGKALIFNLDLRLSAKILRWNLSRIGLKNCDVRVLGVRVVSFCGLVRRTLRDYVARFTRRLSAVQMPQLLRRVEDLLKARVGEEVVVPLLLAEEKQQLVGTVVKKAENVARLKSDLIEDLSAVAGGVAGIIG